MVGPLEAPPPGADEVVAPGWDKEWRWVELTGAYVKRADLNTGKEKVGLL